MKRLLRWFRKRDAKILHIKPAPLCCDEKMPRSWEPKGHTEVR